MKQSKVTNIKSKLNTAPRKLWVTRCNQCGGVDCAIDIIKEYNCDRDLKELAKEGRKVSEYTQIGKTPIPWCDCLFEDGEVVEE